ncbi:MAG: glycosyltransferase family 1 protein [Candidatus Moraniibacteriota bacterium]
MRIGIDARFYGSLGKGLGRYTEKLIEGLERQDSRNEYFVFLRKENFDAYVPRSEHFHKVLADYSWYGWREQTLFPRLLRRLHLDLIHFPHFNVPLFYRRRFVVTIHDLILLHFPTIKASELPPFIYWMKYWAYRFVIRSAIERARTIFTVSHFTLEDIQKHYPCSREKLFLTYESADPFCRYVRDQEKRELFSSLHLLSTEDEKDLAIRPYALYVGNAYPHKNLESLLDVAHAFPELVFVLVGKEDYFYRALQEKVSHEKLSNILFAGFVPDSLLSALYEKARVYLFPSLYEGFGLPALEAAAHGLPVLAADRGSLREIMGEGALYFDPSRKSSFRECLAHMLEDEALRQRLRLVAYERLSRFSWEKMAHETLSRYHEVTGL